MAKRPATGMDDEALKLQELDRRLRALESNVRGGISGDGVTTFLRDQDFRVIGGSISVEAGGDIVITGGQLVAGPTTVDASGVDIGSGLVVMDATGLQVGTDVDIDSTGLHVIGGLVTPLWFNSDEDDTVGITLTTTDQTVGTVTIDPPDWVTQLTVFAFARQDYFNPGSEISALMTLTLDDGGAAEDSAATDIDIPANRKISSTIAEESTFVLSPAGRTVTVTQEARLAAGTFGDNLFSLKVFAIGTRSA